MRDDITGTKSRHNNGSLRLWLEWPVLLGVVIALMVWLRPYPIAWWAIPVLLTIIPLGQRWLAHQPVASLGLQSGHVQHGFRGLAWACGLGLPLGIAGLMILRHNGWTFACPLTQGSGRSWFYWTLAQFIYVAFPEELFFRGYLQGRLHQLMPRRPGWVILLSAVLFGLAHLAVQRSPASCLTVLPAVLFGWLYWRSRSLLTPILFHAACNIVYAVSLTFLE